MAGTDASEAASTGVERLPAGRSGRSGRPGWRKWAQLLGLIVVVPATVIAGTLWWQDRPLRQAAAQLENDEPQLALQTLNAFLDQNPQNGRALTLKAHAFVALGQWEQASRQFAIAGASDVEDLHAWAQALLRLELWSKALPVLEQALRLDPDEPDVLHELTACQFQLGRYDDALEAAERLASIDGHQARGYLQMGMIQRHLRNTGKALEAWDQVRQHQPAADDLQVSAANFFLEYGRALIDGGRLEEARESLESSLQLEPSAETRFQLGEAALQLGDTDDARRQWEQAVQDDPDHPGARTGLARLALQRGDAGEALQQLQPLVEDSRRWNSGIAYLMQRALAMSGNTQESREWQQRSERLRRIEKRDSTFEQVLNESPHSYWARAIRAYRFAEAGNWDQGRLLIEELIQQGDPHPFVLKLREAVRTRSPLPSLDEIPVNLF